MADPSLDPDTGDDTSVEPTEDVASDRSEQPPSTPRWVKVFGIIAIILILLIVLIMFIGGGDHGPGRHTPTGAPGSHIHTIEYRLQQP